MGQSVLLQGPACLSPERAVQGRTTCANWWWARLLNLKVSPLQRGSTAGKAETPRVGRAKKEGRGKGVCNVRWETVKTDRPDRPLITEKKKSVGNDKRIRLGRVHRRAYPSRDCTAFKRTHTGNQGSGTATEEHSFHAQAQKNCSRATGTGLSRDCHRGKRGLKEESCVGHNKEILTRGDCVDRQGPNTILGRFIASPERTCRCLAGGRKKLMYPPCTFVKGNRSTNNDYFHQGRGGTVYFAGEGSSAQKQKP